MAMFYDDGIFSFGSGIFSDTDRRVIVAGIVVVIVIVESSCSFNVHHFSLKVFSVTSNGNIQPNSS